MYVYIYSRDLFPQCVARHTRLLSFTYFSLDGSCIQFCCTVCQYIVNQVRDLFLFWLCIRFSLNRLSTIFTYQYEKKTNLKPFPSFFSSFFLSAMFAAIVSSIKLNQIFLICFLFRPNFVFYVDPKGSFILMKEWSSTSHQNCFNYFRGI